MIIQLLSKLAELPLEDFLFGDRHGDQYICLGDQIYQNQCIFWSWRPHIGLPSAGISAQTCSNLRSFLLSLARPVKLHFKFIIFFLILEILVNCNSLVSRVY